jgi:hypothetical protein
MANANISLPPDTRDNEKTLFQFYNQYFAIDERGFWGHIFVQAPHVPGFSRIQSEEMMNVISNLIANWNLREARGTGAQGTIIRAQDISYLRNNYRTNSLFMSARIDLQGRDSQQSNRNVRFERYAIQIGSEQFATVHIQVGRTFDVRYIRRAFWLSVLRSNDVWIGDGFSEIPSNVPGRWENYRSWLQSWADRCANEKPYRHDEL